MKEQMSRVLLLIPSASYRAPDFMEAAAKLGVDVAVGSDHRHPLQSESNGNQINLDFVDIELGTGQIEEFSNRFSVDTIIAVDDAGTRLAASASRRLELPHNSLRSVEATRNKSQLRQTLAAADVASPAYSTFPIAEDPSSAATRLNYPVVLKPLALSGSRGVIRADNPSEFTAAFERITALLKQPENARECGELGDRILVEGFVPGFEVSLEGLLQGGTLRTLALFDKPNPLDGPYFEETIYVTPSRLNPVEQQLVTDTAAAACRALGLSDGPVHAELRVNEHGAFPIDVAARSIGGLCARTLTFGTGVSLEEIILRHALGDPISPQLDSRAAGVMMIPIPAEGVLRSVSGVADAESIELIESVSITIRKGHRVIPLPEGSEYLGFIFARGSNPEDVEQALRDAHDCLSFEIE